jgi:cysteine synthase A
MNDFSAVIGNTPLIQYSKNIYVKLEFGNLTGSIKDRPVSYILNKAERLGNIKRGITTLVEATSGNTGIAVATLGKRCGYKVKIIMPEDMSEERKRIISSLGAELIFVPAGQFQQAIDLRDKMCLELPDHYNFNQFHAKENIEAHYLTTGLEIVKDADRLGFKPAGFICGTGTGGTFMGVSKRLRETHANVQCAVVEPAESAVMSGGKPGLHKIQGIGDGSKFLVDMKEVSKVYVVSSSEAINEAKRLNKEEDFFVGISSAANLLAAKRMSIELNGPVVTFFCDSGNRYTSILEP